MLLSDQTHQSIYANFKAVAQKPQHISFHSFLTHSPSRTHLKGIWSFYYTQTIGGHIKKILSGHGIDWEKSIAE